MKVSKKDPDSCRNMVQDPNRHPNTNVFDQDILVKIKGASIRQKSLV